MNGMKIIAQSTLRRFWQQYPDAEQPLKAWYAEVAKAQWTTPHDIKAKYKNASVLKNNRIVFNIKGNKYRLIVACHFATQRLFIKFVGTHNEYDKINAETVELEI